MAQLVACPQKMMTEDYHEIIIMTIIFRSTTRGQPCPLLACQQAAMVVRLFSPLLEPIAQVIVFVVSVFCCHLWCLWWWLWKWISKQQLWPNSSVCCWNLLHGHPMLFLYFACSTFMQQLFRIKCISRSSWSWYDFDAA